jgi:hypothetical protein
LGGCCSGKSVDFDGLSGFITSTRLTALSHKLLIEPGECSGPGLITNSNI